MVERNYQPQLYGYSRIKKRKRILLVKQQEAVLEPDLPQSLKPINLKPLNRCRGMSKRCIPLCLFSVFFTVYSLGGIEIQKNKGVYPGMPPPKYVPPIDSGLPSSLYP